MKVKSCRLLFAACCVALSTPLLAAELPAVLTQSAVHGPQASHAVLLGIARAGARLVAVGERGVVLFSDDNGTSWNQAQVPVSSTLTAVQFIDAQHGWAVGHAGVVLHSVDAGASWSLQLDGLRAAALEVAAAQVTGDERRMAAAQRLVADGADKPLLALSFSDARHGLVVGAYGLALHTDDGGVSWQSWMGQLPNPQGLHLYALAVSGKNIYLAGEQGLFLRSRDAGTHFEQRKLPYDGSFFTLAVLPSGRVLTGGLRGNTFFSDDQGESFQALTNPLPVSLSAILTTDKRLLLLNQAGMLMQVDTRANSMHPLPLPPGPPLAAIAEAYDGGLVGVGPGGPLRLPSLAASSTSAE